RPPLSSPVCSDGHPQVCVWPEDSAFLPEVVEMADRVAEATRDVMGVPERFVQYGVGDYDIINSFQFAAPGSGRWFTAGDLASTVVNAQTAPDFCESASQDQQDERTRQIHELLYWLQTHAYG